VSETRKLAAILVSDVVGYSRLTGADEDRILARPRALRSDLIDPTIAVHHGRIVKRTGDGAIVEFRSVVDAVNCAIEIQNSDGGAQRWGRGHSARSWALLRPPGGFPRRLHWRQLHAESPQRRLLLRRAIIQAARDRASLARSDLQASISLRIADNRGSVACGSSANSLVFSASTVAFSASII
jgi:hypothetical protein